MDGLRKGGDDSGRCGKAWLVPDVENHSPSLACARNTKQTLGRGEDGQAPRGWTR